MDATEARRTKALELAVKAHPERQRREACADIIVAAQEFDRFIQTGMTPDEFARRVAAIEERGGE
jgi:hypothetical protein